MREDLLNELEAEYAVRRNRNEQEEAARRDRIRREYPEFLLEGRMEKPSVRIECGNTFILRKNGEKIAVPEVLVCQWRSPAGKRALILTNYQTRETEVALDGVPYRPAPLDALVLPLPRTERK